MPEYSIEIRNEFDERALDFNDVMYKQQQGTCGLWPRRSIGNGWDAPMTIPWRSINASMRGMVVSFHNTNSWGHTAVPQFAPDGVFQAGTLNDDIIYGHNAFPDEDEEIFVEMPAEGLMMLVSYVQPYTGWSVGSQMVCQPYPGSPRLNYITVNTDEPGVAPEQYGMFINAPDGRRVFDSRHEIVAIQDHVSFTAAEISNVLWNNAVIDKPLRTTFVNPYVSSVDFNSARLQAGNPDRMWLPRLRIINGNIMRLSRTYFQKNAGNANMAYAYTHDSTIFIAEVG